MGVCQGHGFEKAAVHRLNLECNEAHGCGKRIYDLMLALVTEGLGDLSLPGGKWCCDSVFALSGPLQSSG